MFQINLDTPEGEDRTDEVKLLRKRLFNQKSGLLLDTIKYVGKINNPAAGYTARPCRLFSKMEFPVAIQVVKGNVIIFAIQRISGFCNN